MRLPWYTSWFFILICLAAAIQVPPLGLAALGLLSIRVAKERKIFYTAGRTVRGIGWLFFLIFILLIAYGMSEEIEDAVYASFIFLVPGLLLLGIGKRSIAKGQIFSQYIDAIYNRHVRSVHQLAGMFNRTPDVVLSELKTMIRRGNMPGVSVSNYLLTVPGSVNVVPQQVQPQQQVQQVQAQQQVQQPKQQGMANPPTPKKEPKIRSPKTIICRGCGSSTVVRDGEEVECEFCGNILTYDM